MNAHIIISTIQLLFAMDYHREVGKQYVEGFQSCWSRRYIMHYHLP